jgi:hypothetical protein
VPGRENDDGNLMLAWIKSIRELSGLYSDRALQVMNEFLADMIVWQLTIHLQNTLRLT